MKPPWNQQEQMRKQQEQMMKAAWYKKRQEKKEKERRLKSAEHYLEQNRQGKAKLTTSDFEAGYEQLPVSPAIVQPGKRRSCLARFVIGIFKLALYLAIAFFILFVIISLLDL